MRRKRLISIIVSTIGVVLCSLYFYSMLSAQTASERKNVSILHLPEQDTVLVVGTRFMEYLEDISGTLMPECITNDSTLGWRSVTSDKPSFGFTHSVYWFRFTVQQPKQPMITTDMMTSFVGAWLVEIDYPPLDSITIVVKQHSPNTPVPILDILRSGDRIPFEKRFIPHRNFVIPLNIHDTLPRTIYVRVATESSMQMPITLFSRGAFERHNMRFDMFYGALFGTMLTMVAYNLVLFFAMTVSSYLLFVVYMLASVWYYASISGYAAYLIGDMPYLLNNLTLVALFCAYAGLALFGRFFLQTFRYAPLLDKIHVGAGILGVSGALGVFVLPYRLMAISGAVIVFVVSILCFVSSIVIMRRGNRSAIYFPIALAAFLIGALTTVLRNIGFVPNTIFTVHSVEIGSAIEGILFSFGLAAQYRWLKKEKERAQANALRLQQEINERLEEKVRERTLALEESNAEIQRQLRILDEQSREIEIANTTLQEKNLQLEDLNREKNEFLGIAAHDLKNPLSSITMSASIVLSYRDKLTSEQLEERLETILATSGRMMEIIKNLLDVNAIETGQFAFTVEKLDMNEIASGLVREYYDRASAKALELSYENNAAHVSVMGDKTALTEALENLISNAVKYSPPNKRITVRLINTSTEEYSPLSSLPSTLAPMTFLRIAVQDQGPGLSDEDKKKLFGKFARLSARPTGGEHSTGLGLSIVKRMVEAMNGKVWCESELGKGATFIVELPTV